MSDAVLKSYDIARMLPRRGLVAITGLLAAAGLFAVALSGLSKALSEVELTPAPAPSPPPMWLEIQKPIRLFSLEASAVSQLTLTYSARRLNVGDAREDVLSFGTMAGDTPSLRVSLLRVGHGAVPSSPLFVALTREAADAGLAIDRSGLPRVMATRFGSFEIADLTLMGRGDSLSAKAPCSGFRLSVGQPALAISGLACGTPGHPIERQALGCLLDRLDLASAGDDRELIDFFAASELRRDPACAGMRLAPDGVHAAWLDDKPATARKSLRRR